jgi:hypothetical protein
LASEDIGLTGVWQGLYTYPFGLSVSFTAVLTEAGGHLSGSTSEPCSVPGCPISTHDALLLGRRQGNTITFKKTYKLMSHGYGTADYDGALNADSCEIEGHWRVANFGSGKFLMIRSPRAIVAASENKFERV